MDALLSFWRRCPQKETAKGPKERTHRNAPRSYSIRSSNGRVDFSRNASFQWRQRDQCVSLVKSALILWTVCNAHYGSVVPFCWVSCTYRYIPWLSMGGP